jgi:non-ribosomal peptide synthetase component F
LGAGAEAKVGIVLERSFELVVAVLGVLKSGAAYVPVEPQQPAARLQQLLTDAGVSVVLTHSSLRINWANCNSVVCVDEQWDQISQERTSTPVRQTSPAQLLYVMYTSGSTGQPKGVLIQQGGVSNYLAWMQAQYPLQVGRPALTDLPVSVSTSRCGNCSGHCCRERR